MKTKQHSNKKYQFVFLCLAVGSLIACLLELFLSKGDMDWIYVLMTLALSVSFFIEASYPHIYKPNEPPKKIPINLQILLALCYFILAASLIAKFII